ncbi:hypothetical protein Tco_0098071 [Tanacetum coccineum]
MAFLRVNYPDRDSLFNIKILEITARSMGTNRIRALHITQIQMVKAERTIQTWKICCEPEYLIEFGSSGIDTIACFAGVEVGDSHSQIKNRFVDLQLLEASQKRIENGCYEIATPKEFSSGDMVQVKGIALEGT